MQGVTRSQSDGLGTISSEATNEAKSSTIKVVILQPNYIAWKGYFDQINEADYLVLDDHAQYTRSWRNRNVIKTPQGPQWLSIPVKVKGKYKQRIKDAEVLEASWAEQHFRTIKHNYSKTKYYKDYEAELEELFTQAASIQMLSQINHLFLTKICHWLGITTPHRWSDEFEIAEGKNERLVGICKQLGANGYISGPAAKEFLDESCFGAEQINVHWVDYSDYPEYNQLYPPFCHAVTILDLLFSEGPDAPLYMKSFKHGQSITK